MRMLAGLLFAAMAASAQEARKAPRAPAVAPQKVVPDQRGTDNSPLVIKGFPPAEKSKAEAEREAKEREEKATTERNTLIFAAIAAIAAVIAAVIAGFQARFFYVQLQLMRAALRDSSRAADAAADSSAALIAAEEAHVFVEVASNTLNSYSDDQTPVPVAYSIATVFFRNYGRTPALVTKIVGYMVAEDSVPREFVQLPGSERDLPPGLGIAPDATHFFDVEATFDMGGAREVDNWNKRVFVVGKIEYQTVMNESRVTGFCWHLIHNRARGEVRATLTRESKLNVRT